MTITEFTDTLKNATPPEGLSVQLRALWYDGKGDWQQAHDLVDQLSDPQSAHVHAYLHRVEGDQWNAGYWYDRAKQPVFKGSLKDEWTALVKQLL
ncbi:hypothetical protein [Sphingobacterium psychroaquaticum]|uniref:Uncharacterized protein n=1 Tax=Sphingobacterium psychroaquaticum TaxID=561061 RepID=A0A1X7KR59_9SPHI|nr:hypothetical protein [Sphingobacterium psychroaquaticum]QBQ40558.1 hypothetical protein E2P86_05085 [Sphingobacterium psychroaquaticum]SMG43631.1 hypothetical protein SAMN05660862_3104 [Sphingobacterium psychroaquaticum]